MWGEEARAGIGDVRFRSTRRARRYDVRMEHRNNSSPSSAPDRPG